MQKQVGILLINIGTPDAPTEDAVRVYLEEFLTDPWVVDYPRWLWKPVLHGIILKTRPPKSARAYQKIWEESGSPLLVQMRSLAAKLRKRHTNWEIAIGMRYGNPSIRMGLEDLREKGVDDLLIFPLFPQYSITTSLSAIRLAEELTAEFDFQNIRVLSSYHDHPAYIEALKASILKARRPAGSMERLLISFHSIPKRYVTRKNDPYLSHCQKTATLLASELGLDQSRLEMAFQSRFGPEPWLSPGFSDILTKLGNDGCQSLQVICPGFAMDCLETLEEVAQEGKLLFQQAGGGNYHYIPALNDSEEHLQALSIIIQGFLEGK